MRTLWRGLVRIVFWSFDRGTWPYDVAVAVIVVFVLFSPRSWFNDRPEEEAIVATTAVPATVKWQGTDPVDGAAIYRVDARLISTEGADLTQQLHDAVRKYAHQLPHKKFGILRVSPVRGRDGAIVYYDVCVTP